MFARDDFRVQKAAGDGAVGVVFNAVLAEDRNELIFKFTD